jgi:branched-chain amino acid transport system substrate-binding protein
MAVSVHGSSTGGGWSRRLVLLAIALALALVAVSCGSADRGDTATDTTASGSGTGSDETTGGSETGDTTSSGSGSELSGESIKVMTEAPVDSQVAPYPNIKGASEIYEQWVNDNGGIAGRPLEVIFCDDRADPAEAANCARQAVDEGVVANVGSFTIDMSRAIPIMEENSVAWFGACCPIVAQENTSPISFPMGCVACFPTAAAIKMVEDGCQSIVQIYGDLPVADVFAGLFANGYTSVGLDPSGLKVVKIPIEPGDYSSQAAQATSPEVDCLFANISEINWPPLITALNGVGATPRLYGPQGNLNAVIAEQFPAETEGAIVVNVYPNIAADVWADYREALETYNAADLDWNSLAGLGTWAAFTAFRQIVEGMEGEINNETFLAAASATDKLDTGGMVGVLDFTQEWEGGGGQFPRIFNRTIFFDEITGGELTPIDGEPLDMTKPFDGEPA